MTAKTLVVIRGESVAFIVTEHFETGALPYRTTERLTEPLTAELCQQWLSDGHNIREGFYVGNSVLLVQPDACWHAVDTRTMRHVQAIPKRFDSPPLWDVTP